MFGLQYSHLHQKQPFISQKLKNVLKISNSSHDIAFCELLFLQKNADFFCKKNADISKIKVVLVLKGIISKISYVCVRTYQISSFGHNAIEF